MNKSRTTSLGLILSAIIAISFSYQAKSETKKKPKNQKSNKSSLTTHKPTSDDTFSVVIETPDEGDEDDSPDKTTTIERLMKNQVFASGISNGADAINRSISSLMESLFYNLMDNDLKHALTGSANVVLGVKREVYQAEKSAWVVVDKFGIGPEYSKELYRYNGVPVNLGASQSSDVYDIYLRTDPMRVGESKKLPFWRVAFNNWFGILPILETVLPPSFNVNEMYDPLRRFEAPFTFPLSKDSFDMMETGSIKSYSISGGINLGVETLDGVHGFKDQITSGSSGLEAKIPYTVFRTGQYRVNVLKKDLNVAWVGISDLNRVGHRIDSSLGKTYYLLSKTIPLWKGLVTPVVPLDFSIEEAIGDVFGRVYSFDLRNEEAAASYLEAVHGNLAPAQISWLRAREEKLNTGVSFFHTKKERRFETSLKSGHNVFVFNKKTNRVHSEAEIEITDKQGKFYILEARQDQNQSKWNMLTGVATKDFSKVADLKVQKVIERSKTEGELLTRYLFTSDPNPIDINLSMQIVDKFVETEDLVEYLDQLGRFAGVDVFDEVPPFLMRDEESLARRRKQNVFITDVDRPLKIHTTPTYLGSFEGFASVRFNADEINSIASLPNEKLWQGFCIAFSVKDEDCEKFHDSLWRRNFDRLSGWAILPLRLADFRYPRADAMDEIESAVSALRGFKIATTPEEKRDELRKLFATNHPLEVVEALLKVSEINEIPRTVKLTTKPKGNGTESAKESFQKMNGVRIHRGPTMPAPARFDSTLDTESKFSPSNLAFTGIKPAIKKLSLHQTETSRFKTGAKNSKNPIEEDPILNAKILGARISGSSKVYVYVRLEQTGKVQLAKFKLIEQVVEIPSYELKESLSGDNAQFSLIISGAGSTLANVISTEALNLGGSFRLTVAASPDNQVWSDERSVEFSFENGKLQAK